MAKKKVGKQRKDKYYQLAKETGFRSRAAFKLIQLNRKFEFLQKSRVCIDLCAAPGGWMQVAKQNMPLSSIVVGIDLFPINAIPGCISLTEDITTEKCRVALTKELQTWKADVVLHDGAPNVGQNWLHDAYQQNCLTLSALKLAIQFLRPGGWFVTKIFRSKDYHSLVYVLKQLFNKVHATKPQASRTESAEIFVVCQDFKNADKIDPRFTDHKHVFKELDIEPQNKLNVYHPEKKKKAKAEGYPENDYTLYHKLNVSDFVSHENGVDLLEHASEIVFDNPEILNHKTTTAEIKECCKDIKVLGRKDLRNLLAWRKVLYDEFIKSKADETENQTGDGEDDKKDKKEGEDEDDDLDGVDQQILELQEEERTDMKRKMKKAQKERRKLKERLDLKMVLKGDGGPTMEADDVFSLKQIQNISQMKSVVDQTPDVVAESDVDSDEETKPKLKYLRYQKDEQHLDSTGTYYKDSDSELEMECDDDDDIVKEGLGLSDSEEKDDSEKPTKKGKKSKESEHPLITDLDHRDKEQKKAHKAELWFERDVFKNLIDEKDEDVDLDKMIENYKSKGASIIGSETKKETATKKKAEPSKKEKKNKPMSSDSDYSSEEDSDSDTDTDTDSDGSDYVVEKQMQAPQNNADKDGFEIVKNEAKSGKKRKYKLTSEELALGTMMVNSKKTKRDLVDAAWNRYAFNDKNLPDWFVQDEQKHMKKEAPVPKDLVDDYNKRLEEINVRPIKKVIEAKARKKKQALRKLEKAKKKAEALIDNEEITDREKAKKIKQLYKAANREPRKEVTYVVSKKHMAAKKVSRPSGVKGPYKVVDPRMKKDLRAQKAKAKTMGRGKGKGGKAYKGGKGGKDRNAKNSTKGKKGR